MKQRIKWIDYLKGITILLVIVGHTIGNYYIRTFIFSFHMPMFFILSGYVSSFSKTKEDFIKNTTKSFRKLIISAYTIWIIRIFAYHFVHGDNYSTKQYILSAIYASGKDTKWFDTYIPAFGMMWFLIALFISRIICDLIWLNIKSAVIRNIIVSILCMIGIAIPVYLPISLDVGCVAVFFYHIGRTIRERNNLLDKKSVLFFAGIMWIVYLVLLFVGGKHFEMATREFPYFILSVVMSSFACLFLCAVINQCKKFPMERIISYIGYHSLDLFIIHAFDTVWYMYLKRLGNIGGVLLVRLVIDLCILYMVVFARKKHIEIKKN